MENNDKKIETKSNRLWVKFKNEFRKENFSLSFEKNSEFMKKDPEEPWPVYMTSWSLTILFIHLWISALIVVYFYSIDQNSLLAKVFTFLFGPFSCSRKQNNNRDKIQTTCANNNESVAPLNESIFSRVKNYSFFVNKIDNSNINEKSTIKIENDKTELENLNPIKDETRIDPETLQNLKTEPNQLSRKKTFCDNKLNCYLPSSSVTSDAASWKLWIDSHVPGVILVLIKTSWMLYNQIVISAIVVTIGYFTYVIIFDIETEPTWVAEIGNLHRHGFNSIVAIIDIVILAYPVRILHFIYTSAYGWVYAFATFFYWLQDPKKNIVYEQIDYNKPFLIISSYTLLTLLTFLMQIFHFFAYQFKVFLKEKYLLVKKNCFSKSGL